ncbi:hypothetical protein [uncultured Stenotrophomonas sp.]|uniref:hypothetical protein n=1 Tax=uncultured Stenotrophomonas sp. TaxID=165438 RepID=UPI0025FAD69F|nr:hypothetical protein [uncultured Stenotrophomonas sp.]
MTTLSKATLLKALQLAVKRAGIVASSSNWAQGKAYELKVLTHIVNLLDATDGYTLWCTPNVDTQLTFGGGPCKPDASKYDFITVRDGMKHHELWISVQFTTLSYRRGGSIAPPKCSDLHELDIGLYEGPLGSSYPSYEEVVFAASCKAGTWHKMQAREALGLRRELGFLSEELPSLAQWFEAEVPTNPASPLALYSRDINSVKYAGSLSSLGLYVKHYP